MKLYFATGNKNKAREAEKILSIPIEIVNIEIDEIQSLDLKKIVEAKTKAAFEKIGKPVFVDDVSAEFPAWNGFPGPFIKYLYEAGNNSHELLLKMLSGQKDKSVIIRAAIGYHDGKTVHVLEGSFKGRLVRRRGNHGWGFDPYVIPDGYTKTFGELGEDIKNKISHRARALRKFKKFLNSQSKS